MFYLSALQYPRGLASLGSLKRHPEENDILIRRV